MNCPEKDNEQEQENGKQTFMSWEDNDEAGAYVLYQVFNFQWIWSAIT